MWKLFRKYGDNIIVFTIFLVILLFILDYIPISLVFAKTIPSGGDTGSHYYSAWYLKTYLLDNFKIIGWSQGWFGGYPMFQFYFPLPFLLIALLGYLIPLQIAFKLVTFLAIISIQYCAFFLLRCLDFSKQISVIGSVFTLPFLFIEANSLWGGNILSTFSGEFTFGLGIALSLVYFGLMYKGIQTQKHLIKNSILLAAIGFTHVYTLLWAIATSVFLLLSSDYKKRFAYWFKVNALAFLLLGFWIIPLIYYLGYTSAYADKWVIEGWQKIFPKILWPFLAFALIGIAQSIARKEKRMLYLLFSIAMSLVFYLLAFDIGVVDIRFLPFIQLLLLLIAAYPFIAIYKTKLHGLRFIPIVILLLTILWVQPNVNVIPSWADWNYKGFENKLVWDQYSSVNDFLKGNENDPRVFYTHSLEHKAAGSSRAYELLPLLSGRSTLEGLYMQSTPTSPSIYYIQSETTTTPSCPFPNRNCTYFDLDAGTEHLKLFNVQHFVAVAEKVKDALRNHSEYELVFEKGQYEVYELTTNENTYVTIPKYKPVYFPRENWQDRSYELFPDYYDVPIIFDESVKEEPEITRDSLNRTCNIDSTVRQEEILFTTDCVGVPHLIKISYFPRWKSENGEKIHLVGPSFMLIYPEKEQTRLYFGRTWVENSSLLLSVIGWILILVYWIIPARKRSLGNKKQTKRVRRRNKR